MAYQLEFDRLFTYDAGQPGITLQTNLTLREKSLDLAAKVDTGASCCIFERRFGEELGFGFRNARV